jgi:type II secretory pathway component PulF
VPRILKAYIAGVVTLGALALVVATLVIPVDPQIALVLGDAPVSGPTQTQILAGIAFWILINLAAAALPVTLPHGTRVDVTNAPTLAAILLGGPAVGGWVALVGTTEVRELKGEVPWYGSLINHASIVLPAVVAGVV